MRQPSGAAAVRLFTLSGHWRTRWDVDGEHSFTIAPADYRRFAATVDAALAAYRRPVPDADNGETIVCMDGPGFVTERVRAGRIVTLTGQCPAAVDEEHPNRTIAAAVDALLCRHLRRTLRSGPFEERRCRR